MAAVTFVEETPSSWVYPKMVPAANMMCVNELHHAQVKELLLSARRKQQQHLDRIWQHPWLGIIH